METILSKSPFQLIGTSIRILTVENNFAYFRDSENVKRNLTVKCDIKNIDAADLHCKGIIHLITDLSVEEGDCKLNITLCLEGCFHFDTDNAAEFETMLKINGSSALYSISRSIISSIASQSYAGDQLVLPMLNFAEMMKEE